MEYDYDNGLNKENIIRFSDISGSSNCICSIYLDSPRPKKTIVDFLPEICNATIRY